MSGLFDNKAEVAKRRDARDQKEKKARRKTRTIGISVVSVVTVLFICAFIINSVAIRRHLAVITIGDRTFTAVEFDYFYNNAYIDYSNMVHEQFGEEFANSILPDPSRLLSQQIYNHETGETWSDFFVGLAIDNMSNLSQLYSAARAAGFALTSEHFEEIDNQIDMIAMQAEMSNFPSTNRFLQQFYGTSINEAAFRGILEFLFLTDLYSEHVRESLTYTAAELEVFYGEHRDFLDIFSYRMIPLDADTDVGWDFETMEELDAAREAARFMVTIQATDIITSVENEEDFIEAVINYGGEGFDPDFSLWEVMGEMVDFNMFEWLTDDSRRHGDMEIFTTDEGVEVVFFVSRDDNDYFMAEMRQIMIARDHVDPEDFFDGEFDPEYNAAMVNAERELNERAETVMELFRAGGSNVGALIALMGEHSDDWTEGGLYTHIAKFFYETQFARAVRMPPEIEQWLFDPARQAGDSELIYTEAFGYHLLYFEGHGERFRDFVATDRKRFMDHREWLENFPQVEAVRHWSFFLTSH